MLTTQEKIKEQIANHSILLYMKGNAQMPLCGFSARAVHILKSYQIPFATIDVLQDEEIRNGIKAFSNWPTIPQLYIQGEFIGGSDIMTEMHENGELKPLLEKCRIHS